MIARKSLAELLLSRLLAGWRLRISSSSLPNSVATHAGTLQTSLPSGSTRNESNSLSIRHLAIASSWQFRARAKLTSRREPNIVAIFFCFAQLEKQILDLLAWLVCLPRLIEKFRRIPNKSEQESSKVWKCIRSKKQHVIVVANAPRKQHVCNYAHYYVIFLIISTICRDHCHC